MKSLKHVTGLLVVAALMLGLAAGPAPVHAADDEVLKIDWTDLIPKEVSDETISELMEKGAKLDEENDTIFYDPKIFPMVKTLNGKTVRIPGYVVPLDMELTEIKEFLLVPYFGACIHVPPPPPNQIIYVKTKKPLNLKGLDYAVEVTGKISTAIKESGVANTGYTLESKAIVPYEEK
ncbi:MAG: DUF3299 domain-containing protein [Hyphomicrobiales bacterium]|nr:MAG: DUF3299 domain-containing protein [Hyphomicrobiales bacterium]